MKTLCLLTVSALMLSACGANEDRRAPPEENGTGNGNDENQEENGEPTRAFIQSYTPACIREGQHLCLLWRETENDDFELFYFADSIEGFDFRWGFQYELMLNGFPDDDPDAEAPGRRFELSEIISEQEDPIGTQYQLNNIRWQERDVTFRQAEDHYLFLDQPFLCGENVNCDALYSLDSPGGEVNLTFRYLGYADNSLAPIELIRWE